MRSRRRIKRHRKDRLQFAKGLEPKTRTPFWHYAIWVIVLVGSLYFPFVRSPKMTNSELMINYWWFYLPALIGICAVTVWRRR